MVRWCLGVALLVAATSPVSAQTQIKPYFMVIFDDSGSMTDSTGGGTNSCGQSRNKLNDAKCALQQVVNGYGDVVFGLTSFKTYGTGTTIHATIMEDNQPTILQWVDFMSSPELTASGGTPITSALNTVRSYYQSGSGPIQGDPARGCRPYRVILLHDGAPNSLSNSIAAASNLRNTPVAGGPNEDIRTHVIYFGTSATTLGQASQIANAGGTTAAIQAVDETDVALAFSQIIADTLLTEICDGDDDDCDGIVDEGFQKYCDLDGVFGAPTASADYCSNPGDDCDMSDDNCFSGITDEPLNACGTCGPPPAEICDGIDNNCNGIIDEGGICMGCVPTGAETCDNMDNDCDGSTDEGLTRGCGSDVGVCMSGTETCVAGAWMGCTATMGGPEICDGLDNDCDGRVDGQSRSCGTDTGVCRAGVQVCTSGSFGPCLGEIGPGIERCDGADNDCDGNVDETDPDVGTVCGDDTGECETGTIMCVGGALMCVGAVGPTPEICDGLDNDCDGLADDGLGVGAPCGSSEGLCIPGITVCRDGMTVCDGEVGPVDEVCNAFDDDCDGTIDEALPLGGACGSAEGLCMEGVSQCIDGREVCVGEVPPETEGCDCEDNDCDGSVDEMADTLCPGGSTCVDCQCALPCDRSEFGFVCPTGKTPLEVGEECFCVAEACTPETCSPQTIETMDTVRCSPDDDTPDCVCKNNACTFPCDGTVCVDGTVCEPNTGTCVEDSCRALGCGDGEVCDVDTGECVTDPCTTVECDPTEGCIDGTCVASCAGVECSAGERCRRGECVDDACGGVSCPLGEACDPTDGSCVEDMCLTIRCPAMTICDPLTGECEEDPCVGLSCPDEQVCQAGECVEPSSPDAGVDGGLDAGPGGDDRTRLLGAGGGGCACAVPGTAPTTPTPWALGFAVFALVAWRRRTSGARSKKARGRLAALLGLAALVLSGCDVEPYCIDCEDAGTPPGDAAVDGTRPDTGVPDAALDVGLDTAEDAGCAEGAPELCNERDDDCDGLIDEGIDTNTDTENCGGCGMLCAPPAAFPVCTDGVCGIDRCDVGFIDIDGDPENGCEYRCIPSAADDSTCDFRDNDCDGSIDEDFDFDTDVDNCGSCGRTCRFAHADATCSGGACQLGDCEDGFYDRDGIAATGCEYACTLASPPTEVCNRRDDDCDGTIDEGDPGGGATCGIGTGACMTGVEQCLAGVVECVGSTEPSTETCNMVDDDCDGSTDEGFLSGDINNCGMCGNVCAFADGFAECQSGSCVLVACEDGYWDANGNPADGCEYRCDFSGAEACNGVDDDCDAVTDEDLSPPSNFCNPNGVCAGAAVLCNPAVGWECDYPSTYQDTETRCDGLDNDCDGQADEPFLAMGLGTSCSNGTGACLRSGTIVCTVDMMGVACNAPAAGTPGTEICDGLDNDCDGLRDENQSSPGTNPSYVVEPMVEVTQGGPDFWMYVYEASRPDATSLAAGASDARACSRASVLPWTQVSYPEARDACIAAGMRLCTESEWERACESGSGSCNWAEATSCGSYGPDTCNGNEYDPIPGAPDDDLVLATQSLSSCYVSHGGGSNRIYDLSGNVKEWTQARSAGVNPLRGGSMNNPRNGLRCDFDFTVADDVFQFTNVGFRCCSNNAP